MENQQFNLRLDAGTVAALKRLAQATHRSQAGVVRWLILAESEKYQPHVGEASHPMQEVITGQ